MFHNALLMLEDGFFLRGVSVGAELTCGGEVVFNTAMTGYQEILSDPSYAQQIVTLTYPHVGNTGINPDDNESREYHLKGLVMRDMPSQYSNWRAHTSLQAELKRRGIAAIAGVDTRALTHHLRQQGALRGVIVTGAMAQDPAQALAQAQQQASLVGVDLASQVTCAQPYRLPAATQSPAWRVVVVDYGVKQRILDQLTARGCDLTVVPAQTDIDAILRESPQGVVLSNGPGDPAACTYALPMIQGLLKRNIPLLGICLGHQLLALALGAKTYKMRFGHHGSNHPVQTLASGKVWVTAQNHGFAVEESSLPPDLQITHRSLFDHSIQGLRLRHRACYSFQGHPEAGPGPHDAAELFQDFMNDVQAYATACSQKEMQHAKTY